MALSTACRSISTESRILDRRLPAQHAPGSAHWNRASIRRSSASLNPSASSSRARSAAAISWPCGRASRPRSSLGGSTRQPIMTAYRQQALACAAALARARSRPRDLKPTLPDARKILLRNVYGWFVKVERGVYTLSEGGKAALVRWKAHLPPRPWRNVLTSWQTQLSENRRKIGRRPRTPTASMTWTCPLRPTTDDISEWIGSSSAGFGRSAAN